MKTIRFIPFFLILPFLGFSQNLIPNPSFEEYETAPNCSYSQCGDNLECATGWINPTSDTPDYFNAAFTSCLESNQDVTVPNNWLGYQMPRTGNGYAGIHTYTTTSNEHEYLIIQLTEPLYKGQSYNFSMYVSKADDQVFVSNGLGIYLSVGNSFINSNCCNIFEEPQFMEDDVIYDDENWIQTMGSFVADTTYDYISIGRFISESDPRFILEGTPQSFSRASYFIDDVSLIAHPVPDIELAEDVVTCDNNYILDSPVTAESYLWSTGDDSKSITITESGEYWLEVIRFGEVRRDSIIVTFTSGTNIFPNPSNGNIHLSLGSPENNNYLQWNLYDASGKFISEGIIPLDKGFSDYPLDLSSLASGLYLIEYTSPCNDKKLEKIIITR